MRATEARSQRRVQLYARATVLSDDRRSYLDARASCDEFDAATRSAGFACFVPTRRCSTLDFFYHAAVKRSDSEYSVARRCRQSSNPLIIRAIARWNRSSRSHPSPSSGGLRRSWTRRTRCGPSAAPPSPNSTPSPNPSSSTCSATPPRIRRGGRRVQLLEDCGRQSEGVTFGMTGSNGGRTRVRSESDDASNIVQPETSSA